MNQKTYPLGFNSGPVVPGGMAHIVVRSQLPLVVNRLHLSEPIARLFDVRSIRYGRDYATGVSEPVAADILVREFPAFLAEVCMDIAIEVYNKSMFVACFQGALYGEKLGPPISEVLDSVGVHSAPLPQMIAQAHEIISRSLCSHWTDGANGVCGRSPVILRASQKTSTEQSGSQEPGKERETKKNMTYKKVSSVSTSMKVTLKILYDNGDGEDYDEAGWYWELDGYDDDDGGFMSDDHGGPFKTRAQAVSDGKASVPRHLGYSP